MKTFNQFCVEAQFNLAKEVTDAEKNVVNCLNKGGQGCMAARGDGRARDRNNPGKEVPGQVRHAQDLRAAQVRSQKRQGM